MIGVWKSHGESRLPFHHYPDEYDLRFNFKIIIKKKEQNSHLWINLNKKRKKNQDIDQNLKKNVYFVDKKRRTHLKDITQGYDNSSRIHYGIVYTRKSNDETRWCLECTVSLTSTRIVFYTHTVTF